MPPFLLVLLEVFTDNTVPQSLQGDVSVPPLSVYLEHICSEWADKDHAPVEVAAEGHLGRRMCQLPAKDSAMMTELCPCS